MENAKKKLISGDISMVELNNYSSAYWIREHNCIFYIKISYAANVSFPQLFND